jgi:hypothetical protein
MKIRCDTSLKKLKSVKNPFKYSKGPFVWTPQEYAEWLAQKPSLPAKSKYGNKRTMVDGIRFMSMREASYYGQLKMLERAGEIHSFELQVPFPCKIEGLLITTYVADFVIYYPDGHTEIHDTKGFRTHAYRIKKKLVEAIYGKKIIEK